MSDAVNTPTNGVTRGDCSGKRVVTAQVLLGDVRHRLSDIQPGAVQTCVTSPPYWGLRDYGHEGQIGLEQTPDEYVVEMVAVFREVHRVLADDGVLWLNLGDSYAGNNSRASNNGRAGFGTEREGVFTKTGEGLKDKDLVGIPWRVALALQADGWYLRQDIIWHKPNPLPESVKDRCTKAHEYLFMLTKSSRYQFDTAAIAESATTGDYGTRNRRSVWTVPVKPFKGAHFAVMPEALVEPCVLSSSRSGDLVLDPFMGAATVGVVALRHGRSFIGCELNPEYVAVAQQRIGNSGDLFNAVSLDVI